MGVGTVGRVVPKGAESVAFFAAETGETKGGASVTPSGPLKPEPALGEK